MTQTPRAVVIGAGLGGLSAAIRLLAQGYDVTVLERREKPGGRAYQLVDGGYTFDMGPSLITMPWLLEELYALAGTTTKEQLTVRPLDPFYRIHWDGEERHFDFTGDRERMLAEIRKFSAADAANYDAFMEASRRIYEDAILVAGRKPFLSPLPFAALVPSMLRLDAVRSLRGFVGKFFAEEHVRQAFDFHSLFIGGNPWSVPAVYTALSYLQVADGVWYADGGVYSVVQSLVRLIERGGGRVLTNAPVERIETWGGKVSAVRLASGESVPADLVVSNADVTTTRRKLLGTPDRLPWRQIGRAHV